MSRSQHDQMRRRILCFRDMSSIYRWIFAKLLSLVHLGTEMNWLGFGVKRSQFTAWPNVSLIFMFPLYLQYLLIDFRHTFVTGASWDTDQSSRSHHRGRGAQHSTLPSSATFSSFWLFVSLGLCIWLCPVAQYFDIITSPLGVLEHSSSCCCSKPNEGTLLLYISVYAVSVDVLTHAVDLHKTAFR